MTTNFLKNLFISLTIFCGSSSHAGSYDCDQYTKNPEQLANPWAHPDLKGSQKTPEVIGYYSRGCLQGGTELKLSGEGHEVVCSQRKRNWGHPQTIAAIKEWGLWSKRKGYGKLIIRDISQAMGGPIYGHGSHQVGRDIDINFATWSKDRPMSPVERQSFKTVRMATNNTNARTQKATSEFYNKRWKKSYGEIIEKIASSDKTARIFISPPIKKALCRQFVQISKGSPPSLKDLEQFINSKKIKKNSLIFPKWLRRLQPMSGHDGHFHVRMKCPTGSKKCQNQMAMENSRYNDKTDSTGVGCSGHKLNWWTETNPKETGRLKDKINARARSKKKKGDKKKKTGKPSPWWEGKQARKNFPKSCRELILQQTKPSTENSQSIDI